MKRGLSLGFVKDYSPATNLAYFPDFLIVGPQRTGTTWIHTNLSQHPQIFLSTPKEIYFFNKIDQPKHSRYRSSSIDWYLQHFEESFGQRVRKNFQSLRKYREFYIPKCRGEATASYAALKPEIIKDIVALNPKIKAILMVRDPVDRAWSHLKKDLIKEQGKNISQLTEEEITSFLRDPYQIRCSQYSAMIGNWSAELAEGNLFVGHFDQIHKEPEKLLADICSFLDVTFKKRYFEDFSSKKINPTPKIKIPEEYRSLLFRLFQNELAYLHSVYGQFF